MDAEDIVDFLQNNNLHYDLLPQNVKMEMIDSLLASSAGLSRDTIMTNEYFQLPFEKALDLVCIYGYGYCYVYGYSYGYGCGYSYNYSYGYSYGNIYGYGYTIYCHKMKRWKWLIPYWPVH